MLIGFETIIDYIKKNKLDSLDRDVYEFGVCTGGGTGQILEAFTKNNIKFDKFYGFDSWEGLPEEKEGVYKPDIWHKGAFTAHEHLHLRPEDVIPHLQKYTSKLTDRSVEFISGFYENSLTPKLIDKKKFKPALFISIDVDIYKSAYEVLDYVFRNAVAGPDTIIRYDDWGDFTHPMWKGKKEGEFGESLAHKEISEKYGLKFDELYCQNGVKIVAVVK